MLGGMEFEVNQLSKHTLDKASKAKQHLEAYYKVTHLAVLKIELKNL